MASHIVVQRGSRRVKLRPVAPGEVELGAVALLQFIVTAALLVAPPRLLAGNGTALLTLAHYPNVSFIVKGCWAIVFFSAGLLCTRAITSPGIESRKWAWQLVIPLWAAWLTGLTFPMIVGRSTNVIMLSAVAVLVIQWLVTRLLVPLDSYWYSREVPIEELYQGERSLGVDLDSCGSGV